jgi:hypothetical protein
MDLSLHNLKLSDDSDMAHTLAQLQIYYQAMFDSKEALHNAIEALFARQVIAIDNRDISALNVLLEKWQSLLPQTMTQTEICEQLMDMADHIKYKKFPLFDTTQFSRLFNVSIQQRITCTDTIFFIQQQIDDLYSSLTLKQRQKQINKLINRA